MRSRLCLVCALTGEQTRSLGLSGARPQPTELPSRGKAAVGVVPTDSGRTRPAKRDPQKRGDSERLVF